MARVHLIGIVNNSFSHTEPPKPGFRFPAFRFYGDNWRHTSILIPMAVNDRFTEYLAYDTKALGCHPIWNDGNISGATMFLPNQAALYAFRFPSGHTYVALRELIIARIRLWLNEHPEDMLKCDPAMLEEARAFCNGHLPASLDTQMKAIANYAQSGQFASLQ